MSRGDLPAVSVWGRPFKTDGGSGDCGVTAAGGQSGVGHLRNAGVAPRWVVGDDWVVGTIGLLAGITVASMVWSWVITSQFPVPGVDAVRGGCVDWPGAGDGIDGRFWQAWLPFCFAGMIFRGVLCGVRG